MENTARDHRVLHEPLHRVAVTAVAAPHRGTIRYWAAAREAAGCAEEDHEAATLDAAMNAARAGRDQRFADVVRRCSFLVDGDPVGLRPHSDVVLPPGATIDVLPPFAGG